MSLVEWPKPDSVASIDIRIVLLRMPLRLRQRREAEFRVQRLHVSGDEMPAPQPLQAWVGDQRFDDGAAVTSATVLR